MATDKKHIAVYLAPEIEAALVVFCEQKGLKSKKGTMFSAGVNAALAEFFRISDTEESNTLQAAGNIHSLAGNTPQAAGNIHSLAGNTLQAAGNIPVKMVSNIPSVTLVEELPGKQRA